MSDQNATMIHALMIGLVERAGGVEAAARLIDARMGRPLDRDSQSTRKGTLSKRLAGHLSWPLDEIMALEDATGDRCVRRWLAQSLPELAEAQCVMRAMAEISREHGEAMGALADYAVAPSASGRARARKEMQDVLGVLKRLAAQFETEGQA